MTTTHSHCNSPIFGPCCFLPTLSLPSHRPSLPADYTPPGQGVYGALCCENYECGTGAPVCDRSSGTPGKCVCAASEAGPFEGWLGVCGASLKVGVRSNRVCPLRSKRVCPFSNSWSRLPAAGCGPAALTAEPSMHHSCHRLCLSSSAPVVSSSLPRRLPLQQSVRAPGPGRVWRPLLPRPVRLGHVQPHLRHRLALLQTLPQPVSVRRR